IQEGKDTIDLAAELKVPYIRVFGDRIPEPARKQEVIEAIADGLKILGSYASDKGVTVLLETHGDMNAYPIIESIMEKVNHEAVGLLWDFEHPFMHGEQPEDTYRHLAPYIRHTHVKDARKVDGQHELCLIGDGEVPVKRI